jgi:hypothetical protein
VPLAMSFPKVKDRQGIIASGMVGIVRGTDVQRAAEFWVNQYLSPSAQEKLGRANGVAPINPAALSAMRSDPFLADLMLLTPEDISKTYSINWAKIDLSTIISKWNRSIAQ